MVDWVSSTLFTNHSKHWRPVSIQTQTRMQHLLFSLLHQWLRTEQKTITGEAIWGSVRFIFENTNIGRVRSKTQWVTARCIKNKTCVYDVSFFPFFNYSTNVQINRKYLSQYKKRPWRFFHTQSCTHTTNKVPEKKQMFIVWNNRLISQISMFTSIWFSWGIILCNYNNNHCMW